MRRFSNSQKLVVLAAAFNLAALGAFGWLFLGVKSTNEQVSALQNDLELRVKQEQALKSRKMLLADTAQLREKLDGYFVQSGEAVAFLERLEALGREGGATVVIKSVEPVPLPGAAGVEELKLRLEASGSRESITRFAGRIELLPFESSMNRARVFRGEPGPWRGEFDVRALGQRATSTP